MSKVDLRHGIHGANRSDRTAEAVGRHAYAQRIMPLQDPPNSFPEDFRIKVAVKAESGSVVLVGAGLAS